MFKLRKDRKENFTLFKKRLGELAIELDEQIFQNSDNKISLAISLVNLGEKAKELGSRLYHRGVMGARVVTASNEIKKIGSNEFLNYESHSQKVYKGLPYMTIAVAIGSN